MRYDLGCLDDHLIFWPSSQHKWPVFDVILLPCFIPLEVIRQDEAARLAIAAEDTGTCLGRLAGAAIYWLYSATRIQSNILNITMTHMHSGLNAYGGCI